jgi:hypothetical protein
MYSRSRIPILLLRRWWSTAEDSHLYDRGIEPTRCGGQLGAVLHNGRSVRLVQLRHWDSDYSAIGELAPALIGELHGAYVHLPQRRSETLVGMMKTYHAAMSTAS